MPSLRDLFNRIRENLFGIKQEEMPLVQAEKRYGFRLERRADSQAISKFENRYNYNEMIERYFYDNPGAFESQYNYDDMIAMMRQDGSYDDFRNYIDYIKDNSMLYYPSQVHGVDHTARVLLFEEMICDLENVDPHQKLLLMTAALFHDIGREDDSKEFDHGKASVEKIEKYDLLRNFSKKDQDIIKFAIASHSIGHEKVEEELQKLPKGKREEYKYILDRLQDADKLDRARIANKGWGLDPNRLATDTAKRLVKVCHQTFGVYYENGLHQEIKLPREAVRQNEMIERAYEQLKSERYPILFEDFKTIVSDYKPGTLEFLMNQGKLKDIFKYDTFLKYGNLRENEKLGNIAYLKANLLNEINRYSEVEMVESILDENFMQYRNLAINNPEGFRILCYANIDFTAEKVLAASSVVKVNDLNIVSNAGKNFRLVDLVRFASRMQPEDYAKCMAEHNLVDLVSSKYVSNPYMVSGVREEINRIGPPISEISEEAFNANFLYIESILRDGRDVFSVPGIDNYSFEEIYFATSRLSDAYYRVEDPNDKFKKDFSYTAEDIKDFMDYSRYMERYIQGLSSEDEQIDLFKGFAKRDYRRNPKFVEGASRGNLAYMPVKLKGKEFLDFKLRGANAIIDNPNISLDEAKRQLVNVLFDIDVPDQYHKEFEDEAVKTMIYHKKYIKGNTPVSNYQRDLIDSVIELFGAKNLESFKTLLNSKKMMINNVDTSYVEQLLRQELIQFTKQDTIATLGETQTSIKQMPSVNVRTAKGKNVAVKVLSGQDFSLAISTQYPKCSSQSRKLLGMPNPKASVIDAMLNRPINPRNRCTSIINQDFIAHARSLYEEEELIYGYVPKDLSQLSISGKKDLSSSRTSDETDRKSSHAQTPRTVNDLAHATTEEHNEYVMHAEPDFIVCFDKVSDTALKKKEMLDADRKRRGLEPIEVVLVESRPYLEQTYGKLITDMNNAYQQASQGWLPANFENLFTNPENNLALRALQYANQVTFSSDIWRENEDRVNNLFRDITTVYESMKNVVPQEHLKDLQDQVQLLIDRSDRSTEYGRRFYDYDYSDAIPDQRLTALRNKLSRRRDDYEHGKQYRVEAVDLSLDDTEENTEEITAKIPVVKDDEITAGLDSHTVSDRLRRNTDDGIR